MDYAFAVRNPQGSRDLGGPGAGSRERNAAFFEQFLERLALNKLHHQIRSLRGLVDTHVMKGDNRRMGDLADHTGFLHEAIAGLAAPEFAGEKLDGDDACDQRIESWG